MILSDKQIQALKTLLTTLIDQHRAHVVVPAYAAQSGYWFGGGNLVQDDEGTIWLSGRYRNYGDSRTGLEAGTRGLECAIFRSRDNGDTFEKVQHWSKSDLSRHGTVLSIEGTGLHRRKDGTWELFISFEKERAYPRDVAHYQKPGTGVWSLERMTGDTPDAFDVDTLAPVLSTENPGYLHIKDPVPFDLPSGDTAVIFCSHPISWASANTGVAYQREPDGPFEVTSWELVERGPIWDVASTRITERLQLPTIGLFADTSVAIYLYDGAESMRQLEENPRAHKRPRGYSCEEIGGAFWGPADSAEHLQRLSLIEPWFVSPFGTGSSRYVSCLQAASGILATWQQSQPDGSQPLVANFVSIDDVKRILSA
jgi:hypothetical protein